MILNYLFYDKLVFSRPDNQKEESKKWIF
jgi:hypothetical protein